ncbi:MAG: hypothetical protein V4616_03455 [Bacteroidota bacterium]
MKKIFFLFLLIACSAQLSAQLNKGFDPERITFGGDFGLGFGSITYVNVSPLVGYRFTDNFTGGVGVIYQYLKYNKNVYGVQFETNTYGGRIFGRYRFLENFFGTLEYQNLSLEYLESGFEKTRVNVPILFVGGGYLQPVGGKAYVSLSLLYDVLENPNSPYSNPVIQAGLIFNP